MVPPLRLPTGLTGEDDVRVWLKLPARGTVSASWLPEQRRFALEYPPGTVAARVESRDGEVADVRGTEIGADASEHFFVYRPSARGLGGFAWPRGSPEAAE